MRVGNLVSFPDLKCAVMQWMAKLSVLQRTRILQGRHSSREAIVDLGNDRDENSKFGLKWGVHEMQLENV